MEYARAHFFGGPVDGKDTVFQGPAPPSYKFPVMPKHFGCDLLIVEEDGIYPSLGPEEAEYRRTYKTANGVSIYEYVEPTEQCEIALIVTVPKKLGNPERGHCTRLVEDALNEVPKVSSHIHYTGPVRK